MFNGDRGINYPKDSDMVQAGIPFVNAGDLQEGKVNLTTANKITREKFDQLGGAKIKRGDILYCLRGTLGKNAFVDNFDEGTVASSLVDIRPKNVDSQYLFTVLNSDIEYRQRILCDEGAAQPNLSARNLANFDIPVPKIEEQVKIGRHFESLSNLITLHQRKCDRLVNVKKALLEKMFPKNGKNVPELRFSGFTEAWEQRKLKELGEIKTGNTPSTAVNEYYSSDGMQWVTPTDITTNIVKTTAKKLSKEGEKVARIVPANTILCTCIASLGKNAIVLEKSAFNQQINSLTTNEKLHDPYFLLTNSFYWSKSMKELAGGLTFQIVNKTEFSEIETWIPNDVEEEKKIGTYFKQLDNLITLHQHKLEKLKNVKKSLLDKMLV